MKLTPEALYIHLRELVETMPDLSGDAWRTEENLRWLGRAAAVVESGGDVMDIATFRVAMDALGGHSHAMNAKTIPNVLHRCLARAELAAPVALQGQFIAAGESLSAFAAVAKIFQRAKQDLLLVDAYADHTVITDFAVTAPEGVHVRILGADKEARKQALRPAVERWVQQFGGSRPLSVRVVPAAALHDRLNPGGQLRSVGAGAVVQRNGPALTHFDSPRGCGAGGAEGAGLWRPVERRQPTLAGMAAPAGIEHAAGRLAERFDAERW